MAERFAAEVCIIGAGPVGGALACRLATAGISTAVVDRAALPPMEHPAFDGRAYAIAAGSRRLLQEAGVWDALAEAACPIRDIRVSDGGLGRAASRLHLHFDHREAGDTTAAFGEMVEARSLRVALNARMHALPALRVFAPATAEVDRRDDGATVRIGGGSSVDCRAGRGGRGAELTAPSLGWNSRHPSSLQPDRHRLRDQPPTTTSQHGARALPAVRAICPTADVRQP